VPPGNSTLVVKVTSQDGGFHETYRVAVSRKERLAAAQLVRGLRLRFEPMEARETLTQSRR
jgi:hypothetical protein